MRLVTAILEGLLRRHIDSKEGPSLGDGSDAMDVVSLSEVFPS